MARTVLLLTYDCDSPVWWDSFDRTWTSDLTDASRFDVTDTDLPGWLTVAESWADGAVLLVDAETFDGIEAETEASIRESAGRQPTGRAWGAV